MVTTSVVGVDEHGNGEGGDREDNTREDNTKEDIITTSGEMRSTRENRFRAKHGEY